MDKKIILLGFGCIFIIFLWFINYLRFKTPDFKDYQIVKARLGEGNFDLYVAADDQKREKGLSNIAALKDHQGMIFIYIQADRYGFWMRQMNFPLDFIFLNDDRVVDIIANISPSTYPTVFTPKFDSNKIIEVKAGTVQRNKIKVGDVLKY